MNLLRRLLLGRPARSAHHQLRAVGFEPLEDRLTPASVYLATDLVSDQPGVAPITDPTLVNAWGLVVGPDAFWASSQGTGVSEVYTGDVNGNPINAPFKVTIPGGSPTGQVFNGTADFVVSNGVESGPAAYIFASESGAVTGWNPNVPLLTSAQPAFQAADGAIYTGIALANNGSGNFLYLADFHNGKIDVLDGTFQKVTPAGNFTDPRLPTGYAPFNVTAINGSLYVSYAKQNAAGTASVRGFGLGLINVFDLNGNFQKRLVTGSHLNSPWAMVLAPANFGDFSNELLVGNFGNGWINAFDPVSGAFHGYLSTGTVLTPPMVMGMGWSTSQKALVIDGLWGLAFGNGETAGDANSLYYTAGPGTEQHGLFGKITANAAGTSPVSAVLKDGNVVITGSRDNDVVAIGMDRTEEHLTVMAGGKRIGTFNAVDVATIEFTGFAGNDRVTVSPLVTANTILDGGAGNDMLIGGSGNNIILGGSGNDAATGRGGRDILIGGIGRDVLNGGAGDDIVIGGTTAHDGNTADLLQIQTVWTSVDTYANRVAALRAGTGVPKLDATTVTNDSIMDVLTGGTGLDWFWSFAPDLTMGKGPAEQVN